MDQALLDLVNKGVIAPADARRKAVNKELF